MLTYTTQSKGYDILRHIAERRADRIAREGYALGASVPSKRQVPLGGMPHAAPGPAASTLLICEIKRRSPSRGPIAEDFDPAQAALRYVRAGADAVSVLTEEDHFGGSLSDLMAVKRALVGADAPALRPVLRKDFLLDVEDIELSYRAGADIVLLLAALLDANTLATLHARATELGMAALVELYAEEDAEKARALAPPLVGINSRDLTTFRVDPLHPLGVATHVDWPASLIYESGVTTAEGARLAASSGFSGLLVGEAVMREPGLVGELAAGLAVGAGEAQSREGAARASGVAPARISGAGARKAAARGFWTQLARRRAERGRAHYHPGSAHELAAGAAPAAPRPLVKICGITNRADAEAAVEAGADILGFVFADSPRAATTGLLRELADLEALKVAVVVAGAGRRLPHGVEEARAAGLIDAVQFHGDEEPRECARLAFPYYKALRLRGTEDAERIGAYHSPRVLIDVFSREAYGGTGKRILPEVVDAAAEYGPLWLAGGIGPENVGEVMRRHAPELIDASSLLEAEPGRKDHDKLRRFFEEIEHATGLQRLLR